MTRTEYQRLEKAIRTEKSQPIIRQMYRPGTIVRQIADKSLKTDELEIKALEIELFGWPFVQDVNILRDRLSKSMSKTF